MRAASLLLASCALAAAAQFPIGSRIESVQLDDHGKPTVISPSDATATVVMFTSITCPISNAYVERMESLFKDYSGKPVRFVFVNSNSNEQWPALDQYLQANKLAFTLLKDTGNILADKFNAQMTPESFVFDKNGVLVYHGRIDDAQNPVRVQQHSLRLALDAMLAGKPVPVPDTRAFGCTIKRVRKAS